MVKQMNSTIHRKNPVHWRQLIFWIFAAAFFTCTWDLLLTHELIGFNLKVYEPLFLIAFLLLFFEKIPEGLNAFLEPLKTPFAISMLLLAGFYMGFAPWSSFPLKSFLYSSWLVFDVFAIWLTIQHLSRAIPLPWIFRLIWGTLLFLSGVILIDWIAYRFGFRGGLIGHNQEVVLNLGISRPHAFASEPSYIGAFLSLGLLTCAGHALQNAKRKWLFGAEFLAILFALVATTSRTGWISLFLGFILISGLPALAGRKIHWRRIAGGIALIVGVVLVFVLAMPPAQRAAMNESLISNLARGVDSSGRLKAHQLAFQMAKETHGLGTGIGASYRYFVNHGGIDPSTGREFSVNHYGNEMIMSTWGQLLAEGGPFALFLYLFAGIALVRALFRKWKHSDSSLALGSLTAALVCFGFIAFFLGNICRGDLWVWYAIWSAIARADQTL